jgi:hypothetical protein
VQVLRNREYLDPKHHYKGGSNTELSGAMPRFFQMGTVQEAPHEYLSQRLTRKERKGTLVAAMLADERFKQYAKKQSEAVAKKGAAGGRHEFNKRRASWSKEGGSAAKRSRF